ncbi:MAG: transporter substrate-binding domain-containing protein [Desulfarculaceae bacterium]|nr:transporter substrate-binding domain-containing protein [Desulfarculaceae bacterium]MCF8046709.1 transporter substrate-binding domain-containing protein [Desulfarculaceae bacterium]MCF8066112.1 transporter substrate-binding domain-containing protein [Desulfarculaceae bacterium]MCF8099210.1 transporter substrate-binding domain-containing protein [Desulfarculaceae bacterium]MCF8124382.1 transporter substrate-binding domain-containing protein [Desulfarculaceae bacterium]
MKKTFLPLMAVFCLALLAVLAAACGSLDKQDPLTSKERAWLKEHGPVMVGADLTYHPFSFVGADGQAEGICAGLWRAMAKKLDFEVRFEALNDDVELERLNSGALDSSTGMFPLGARKKTLDFSEPFYPVTAAIFVASRAHGVRGLEDLSHVKVGAVKDDSGAAILIKNNITPVLFDSYKACVEALGQNKVQAVVMDDPVMLYWRNRLKMGDRISWVQGNAVVERNDLAMPVKKGNQVLLGIINKGLALMAGSEMQRLRERYLP